MIAVMMGISAFGKVTPNERQAREMFDRIYQMVYGPQGSTFRYSVNIVGLYKTAGTICIRGINSALWRAVMLHGVTVTVSIG